MNCTQCGAALPENARFCYSCGAAAYSPGAPGAPPPPPPPPGAASSSPAAATIAPAGAQALKCPACGAPVHPMFGDMVVSCEYCGASVTLGGAGWKAVNKHTILSAKVVDRESALKAVHDFLDTGFLHRKAFEESKVVEEKLSFVPFWIVPVSASTTYQYQDLAVGVGGTIGSIAAAEVLGSALGGGRRGGFVAVPIMGSPVNATRSETIAGTFEYPVVAVKGMSDYQPKNYSFQLTERTFFDRKAVPDGAPILNGDLGEDAAQHAAQSYVAQLQAEAAHKKHHMVSGLQTSVQVSEAELLHVPVFYFMLERKGAKQVVLIDSHAGKVMQTVG
jgi:hypothetical protein